MKRIVQFFGSAAAVYGLLDYTDGMPVTRLLESRTNAAFLNGQSEQRSFHDFKHDFVEHLRLSKISHDEVNQTLRYLYIPKKHVYGFPTVCHGGFSYSICLTLAEHYSKHYLESRRFKGTFMKYTAPLFVETPYIVDVAQKDGQITIEVIDESGKKYAIFTASLDPVEH